MHARFHAPDATEAGQTVWLPPEEAEHLTRVLRLGSGASVRIFNGRGKEFRARVVQTNRQGVSVAIEAEVEAGVEPRVRITLLQAVLKPDAMDVVIRDAVMIGITAIQPMVAARSEATRAALERGRRQERWSRIAVASAKQCGRATVPIVHPPVTFAQALGGVGTEIPVPALMFVEPGASSAAVPLHQLSPGAPAHASIAIGPEGGWAPEEMATAAAGRAQLVTLSLPTLRASVMAIVACAALLAVWREI